MPVRHPSVAPSPARSSTRSLYNPCPEPVQTMADPNDDAHPDSTLLPAPKPTPLPIYQLLIIYLIEFTEPLTTSVVYPFINQFVRDTGIIGGDERKTGYYAGIIGSAFFFSQALTAFHWGAASDRIGRRFILVLGPFGLGLGMLGVGLASDFWSLVFFRCVQGVFDGNIGVSKSVIAEITDDTNIGDAFAWMPMTWGFGTTIGPFLGGVLSEPAKRWPETFGKFAFFHLHPYFLPCAAAAAITFLAGVITFLGLRETLPSALARQRENERKREGDSGSASRLLDQTDGLNYGSRGNAEGCIPFTELEGAPPPPFSTLLVPRVLLPIVVYMFQALIDMSCQVILPLMYSTSISLGGLEFDAYRIGMLLSISGVVNSVVMLFVLGRAVRVFGARAVHIFSYSTYLLHIVLYPIASSLAQRSGGVDGTVWAVIIVQLMCRLMNGMSYGSILILIAQGAPSRSALGVTNGLAQALGSVARALAPSVASSLFSLSLQWQTMGGNMVYIVLAGLTLFGMSLAFSLPKDAHLAKQ